MRPRAASRKTARSSVSPRGAYERDNKKRRGTRGAGGPANPDPKPEREPEFLVRKKLLDKRYLGGLLYLKVGELVVVDRLKDVLPMEAPQGGGEVEDAEVDLYWDEAAEAEDAEV